MQILKSLDGGSGERTKFYTVLWGVVFSFALNNLVLWSNSVLRITNFMCAKFARQVGNLVREKFFLYGLLHKNYILK
jgi:hypothetical protein